MEDDDGSARTAPTLPDEILVQFGREVRIAREARGLTREHFAQRCGLSTTTVKKLEYGRGPHPRLETLIRLSNGLDVALIDLVSCVDPRTSEEHRTIRGSANVWLAALGEAQRELVLALIRVLACGAAEAGDGAVAY